MLNYEITQKASEDIVSAISYIKDELLNTDAAKSLYSEIFRVIENIAVLPYAYTIISESKHVYRRANVKNYKLIYYIEDNIALIARFYGPGQLVSEEAEI